MTTITDHVDPTRYCPVCEMLLNGMNQYGANGKPRVLKPHGREDKGIVIPRGTAIIIEQGALLRDATMQYLCRLYSNALLRACL